jgi:predicted TIM-barrel fold metal-dependent hydrolase
MRSEVICSADDHLDLAAVPATLWQDRLPSALRDRGPRVETHDGRPMWVAGDKVMGPSDVEGRADGWPDPGDPRQRLLALDTDGIQSAVIYGPATVSGLGFPVGDTTTNLACLQVFNDWALEYNAVDPERLCLLPQLPTHSAAAAVAEIERVASAGHKGAVLNVFEIDVESFNTDWDACWAAAAATGLPLSFHIGTVAGRLRLRLDTWELHALAAISPMQLDEILSAMVFSGALDRHPNLRIVLAESGIGWFPYFVERLDHTAGKFRSHPDFRVKTQPSELFQRHVYITFEEDHRLALWVELLGDRNLMWASDYPHPDSTYPTSRKAIERDFAALSNESRRNITGANCAELYGFTI